MYVQCMIERNILQSMSYYAQKYVDVNEQNWWGVKSILALY